MGSSYEQKSLVAEAEQHNTRCEKVERVRIKSIKD